MNYCRLLIVDLAYLIFIYLAVGAVAGVIAGIFGIGGGLVVVPALIYAFNHQGVDPSVATHLAVGTSLATIIMTGASSAWAHYRRNSVHLCYFKMLLPGLIGGAILGVFVASKLTGGILGMLFGLFLIAIAAKVAFAKEAVVLQRPSSQAVMGVAGGIIGIVSALFGVGGGTLSVPWLLSRGCSFTQSVGTSSACSVFIALFGAMAFVLTGWGHSALMPWSTGFVYWPAAIGIGITSIPFARVGVKWAHALPSKTTKMAFVVVLLIVGLKFLW